jgi:hypothetical protein
MKNESDLTDFLKKNQRKIKEKSKKNQKNQFQQDKSFNHYLFLSLFLKSVLSFFLLKYNFFLRYSFYFRFFRAFFNF